MPEQPVFEDCALKTHFSDFDNLTGGLQPSNLIVIAGRPSNGKTALVMNIAVNIAVRDQKVVGVFSTEMSTSGFIRSHDVLSSPCRFPPPALRVREQRRL
jgi:replicative DNA helicase